ncbi:MAG: hypothetical protein JEZ09_08555 [Salinivirgaceae bacterium]|nr:hypothetical protein [Salinivirgaceae bacterium]
MKNIFFIICIICVPIFLFAQEPDIEQIITKHGLKQLEECTYLNYDNYLLYFNDRTVRIYNNETNFISKQRFTHFKKQSQVFLGISDKTWSIYIDSQDDTYDEFEGWIKIGELDEKQFDDIQIIDWEHFIGHKNGDFVLFYYNRDKDSLEGFNKTIPIKRIISEALNLGDYNQGIFVEIASQDTSKNNRIAYIDYEKGVLKSQFLVDSIYNFPSPFNEFCLTEKDKKFYIYSYEKDAIIDSAFHSFHIVPLENVPLIIKENYIGIGDNKSWVKLEIKNIESIQFDQVGDHIYAIVKTKDNKILNVDIGNKTFELTIENKKAAPTLTVGKLKDTRDGNNYKTVEIGKQLWMAENLAYLPAIRSFGWHFYSSSDEVYFLYDYRENNVSEAKITDYYKTYGVLYTWAAANNACPIGWHLPTQKEWEKLIKHLGGEEIAGGKMKKVDTILWAVPNEGASNSSGFSILPGGFCFDGYLGQDAYFWSSTEIDSANAMDRNFSNSYEGVFSFENDKRNGLSVRCIKDITAKKKRTKKIK